MHTWFYNDCLLFFFLLVTRTNDKYKIMLHTAVGVITYLISHGYKPFECSDKAKTFDRIKRIQYTSVALQIKLYFNSNWLFLSNLYCFFSILLDIFSISLRMNIDTEIGSLIRKIFVKDIGLRLTAANCLQQDFFVKHTIPHKIQNVQNKSITEQKEPSCIIECKTLFFLKRFSKEMTETFKKASSHLNSSLFSWFFETWIEWCIGA